MLKRNKKDASLWEDADLGIALRLAVGRATVASILLMRTAPTIKFATHSVTVKRQCVDRSKPATRAVAQRLGFDEIAMVKAKHASNKKKPRLVLIIPARKRGNLVIAPEKKLR